MNKISDVINCPHMIECSGCSTKFPFDPPPALYLSARKFFEENSFGAVIPDLVFGSATNWRMRAKLACRLIDGKIRFGLYRKNSHDLVSIPSCRVHHPAINRAILALEASLNSIPRAAADLAYNEKRGLGLIRYLQCSVERSSGLVQICFVVSALPEERPPVLQKALSRLNLLMQESSSLFHSLWLNYNPQKTNTIFGAEWERLWGPEYIWERLLGVDIPIQPSHFEQANRDLFEKMVHYIGGFLKPEDLLVELYAGMGVIGLALRARVAETISVEENPHSQEAFFAAKERLPEALRLNTWFSVSDSTSWYKKANPAPHVLVVDPPRKGLSEELIRALISGSAERLIYISCHYPSLERDLSSLISSGQWKIAAARAFLFFPGTDHIETATLLTRPS